MLVCELGYGRKVAAAVALCSVDEYVFLIRFPSESKKTYLPFESGIFASLQHPTTGLFKAQRHQHGALDSKGNRLCTHPHHINFTSKQLVT